MQGLITDRTLYNVTRRDVLSQKGWHGMTEEERSEWLGDPLLMSGVNLFPNGPQSSLVVNLKYTSRAVTATAITSGTYRYSASIVGEAINYQNKTFTLSVDSVDGVGDAGLVAYWHEDTRFEYAGATLIGAGSVTFNTTDYPNVNNLKYFAIYVYVTRETEVSAGATAKFNGVMLENGSRRHAYVPYTEIIATSATKGAYNYSDLNRVELAVAELSDSLGLGLTTKTNWTMWDIPTATSMNRYLSNIRAIRDYFSLDIELPTSMDNLDYIYANNIEKVLVGAYSATATR